MKKVSLLVFSLFLMAGFLFATTTALAATPSLSVSTSGQSGDYVQVNVNGDPNASVFLFVGSNSGFVGDIPSNGTGSFSVGSSASENLSAFGGSGINIATNAAVYVKTGGINGTMSNQVQWPYIQSTTTSNLTLSQSALLLNAGQTSTITAGANYLYLLSNSSPSIANINFNANQITVQALTYGATTANICVVGSTTNCATLAITVQNSSSQQLSFSQNNFSIVSGQSIPVTVTGGSGTYAVSNNSNLSAIQTNLNGSVVTLTASGTSGAAAITVCTTDMSDCGIINVSSTTINSSAVSFSQTNPVVPVGQSTTVTIYGGTGTSFYVSSNSNPSLVQANITNNILTLIANASTGTSTINICAYAGSCGSLTANVSNASTGGALALSQNSVSILVGQSSNITIEGGSTPYSISSTNSSNIFNGVVNGNILTIYGVNPGLATANVCASAGCTTLSVTVNNVNSTTNPPTFSQNNISLNIGQTSNVSISGNGSFYIANNSNPTIASATINSTTANISALASGTTNISICQNGGQCSTLYVTVNSATAQNSNITLSSSSLSAAVGCTATFNVFAPNFVNPYFSISDSFSGTTISNANISMGGVFNWAPASSDIGVHNITVVASDSSGHSASAVAQITVTTTIQPTTAITTPTATASYFTRYLGYGDKGADVLALQNLLLKLGFLTAKPTGRYGPATVLAIQRLQKAHGLKMAGVVGPATKDLLNQLYSGQNPAMTPTKEQQIQSIQQMIQKLQAQAAAAQ